jgi:hypothetical protein
MITQCNKLLEIITKTSSVISKTQNEEKDNKKNENMQITRENTQV